MGEKFSTRVRPVLDPLTGEERQVVVASALFQKYAVLFTLSPLPQDRLAVGVGPHALRATAAVKYTASRAAGDLLAGGHASGDTQGCVGGQGRA